MQETGQTTALARHYLDIERPERALDALDRPGATDPADPEHWYLRGQALYDLERYAEASRTVQAGLVQEPESVPLLFLRCNCEARLGNLAAAEQAILTALRLLPEEPALLCRYALLVARVGQLDKAARLIDEATRIDAEDPAVARARVTLAYLRGNDRQVTQASKELLASDPEDTFGHYMLGHALFSRGSVGDAHRHLRTAAQLDPSEQVVVEGAREARFADHWLLWPLRPFQRFGSIGLWFGFIVLFFLLRSLGMRPLAGLVALLYLILVIYSWVVPWLLRKWLSWRS